MAALGGKLTLGVARLQVANFVRALFFVAP